MFLYVIDHLITFVKATFPALKRETVLAHFANSNNLHFRPKMDDIITNLRDKTVQESIKGLMFYSVVILLVPLASMFFLKAFLFEGKAPSHFKFISIIKHFLATHIRKL